MPLLDTRCLTSSSLNPTSTVYRNNRNTRLGKQDRIALIPIILN
jgi:hypothetical protein